MIQPAVGGVLRSQDGVAEVRFPPMAVARSVVASYRPAQHPDRSIRLVRSFDLEAAELGGGPITTFGQPLTLTVTYTPGELSANRISESTLSLYTLEPLRGGWQRLPSTVDPVNRRVSAPLTHFSAFALGGEPPTALPREGGARSSLAAGKFNTGFYVGNGVDNRAITGVGFSPEVVIILSEGSDSVMRTSSMSGDFTKSLDDAISSTSNCIQSLDSDGFTIGTQGEVNSNGARYHWIAFDQVAGEVKVGSYTGNGSGSRTISGVGFSPEWLIVAANDNSTPAVHRSSTMSASADFDTDLDPSTAITGFTSDGFTIGSDASTNTSSVTYHYVAFNAMAGKMAVGSYSGNGSSGRSISGVGFRPELVIARATARQTLAKTTTSGALTDRTLQFDSTGIYSNGFLALESDGFQVGSGSNINSSSVTYHWVAFGPALNNLVAAYGFGENAGSSLSDSSGHQNHGTISGASWTSSGKNGSALTFDGVDDWVTVSDANSLDLVTGMTLEAWVYPTASGGWRNVLLKERPSGLSYGLYSGSSSNGPSGWVHANGGDSGATGSSTLSLNTWTHIAATFDGYNLRTFVNGSQVAVNVPNAPITTSSGVLRIGGNNVWSEWFTGRIDDVRVYNYARSPSEITTDMNTAVPPALSISVSSSTAPLGTNLSPAAPSSNQAGVTAYSNGNSGAYYVRNGTASTYAVTVTVTSSNAWSGTVAAAENTGTSNATIASGALRWKLGDVASLGDATSATAFTTTTNSTVFSTASSCSSGSTLQAGTCTYNFDYAFALTWSNTPGTFSSVVTYAATQ